MWYPRYEHSSSISSLPRSPIPTRRAILARLADGEVTVNQLVAPFGLRQSTMSKHLKVLERAGLVSRGRDAQFRPVRLDAAKRHAGKRKPS
jgi:DNA-binding transcriptional ArsR family regulator